MFSVVCFPNRTADGRRASSYAAWLAGALGVPLATSLASDESRATESIFVTHLPLAEAVRACPPGAHLLLPLQEDGRRQAKSHGPICLPFGSRDTRASLMLACTIAKQLKIGITAVHTTYRKEGIVEDDPFQHASSGARDKRADILLTASKYGVDATVYLRMVNEIPDFVITEATEADCGLIIMSRGRVLYGSNADRVAARTHLPILIVAESEARFA